MNHVGCATYLLEVILVRLFEILLNGVVMQVTEIPLSGLESMDQQAISDLSGACSEYGFFRLVEHGIKNNQINNLLELSRKFFTLPKKKKQLSARTGEMPWGFFDQELTKNRPDWKEIFDLGFSGDDIRPELAMSWPNEPEDFKKTTLDWHRLCDGISLTIMRAVSFSLGMETDCLSDCFRPTNTSFLRLNYYPVSPNPANTNLDMPLDGHLGIHHHTDAGAVTVLLQDQVPGLQFKQGDQWFSVPADPGSLIINLGDLVQVWSNDSYRAPLHRVFANSEEERFSAAFFMNPVFATECAPLLGDKPRYRTLHWGEYRSKRAAVDYANLGEEIQVDNYRI